MNEATEIISKVHRSITFSFPTNFSAQLIAWKSFKNQTGIVKFRHKNSTVQPEQKRKRIVMEDPFNNEVLISVPKSLPEMVRNKTIKRQYGQL